jgi:hypothetical protein
VPKPLNIKLKKGFGTPPNTLEKHVRESFAFRTSYTKAPGMPRLLYGAEYRRFNGTPELGC